MALGVFTRPGEHMWRDRKLKAKTQPFLGHLSSLSCLV